MKATVKTKVETFKPIEITVTVETEEELQNLLYLTRANVGVPAAVESWEPKASQGVQVSILKALSGAVREAKGEDV